METRKPMSEADIGKVLGDAFLNHPVIDYAFNHEAEQLEKIEILYECIAHATKKYGGIVEAVEQDGVLLWMPRKNYPLSLLQECSTWLISLPFRIGFQSTWDLNCHEQEGTEYILAHAGPNMAYISAVGVRPSSQGRGHCRFLIERAIVDMRAQNINEYWLSTDTEKNVAIYKRLGFEVMIERKMKWSGLKNWLMRRIDE